MNTETLKEEATARIDDDEIVELASQLVQFPSVNPPGDMTEISAFVYDYLSDHGLTPIRYEPVSGKVNVVSVLGDPDAGPVLHLNGHMDVVPVEESHWDFDPFGGEVQDGRLLGRGTSDMKGGLAGLLYTVCTIAPFEDDLEGAVVFTAVPDEETSGDHGTDWLLECTQLPQADACIVGEPTAADTISIGQKGSLWLRFEATGVSSHGSLAPHVGENAILTLADVATELLDIAAMEAEQSALDDGIVRWSKETIAAVTGEDQAQHALDHVTVNIGTIRGGSAVNVIPETAEMAVDMRIPVGMTTDTVRERIEAILHRTQETVCYDVLKETQPNYTEAETPLVTQLAANSDAVFEKRARPRLQWATSDARHYRRRGIPTVQFGPAAVEGIHSHNEYVTVEELINVPRVYTQTVIDYLSQD